MYVVLEAIPPRGEVLRCGLMNQVIIEAILVELVITKECRLYSSAGTASGG
jgi:hypothetical protein